ncbi:MAG TPA: sigma-54 dependent transcriptional regulator [Nitrospira sp.]|mgnify:FL=1|nr:sigma-54-dependent Fis family transcriptional regulator [Nitrospira sp.]MBS0162285.1 sigma-54-dependent Fis family transcriptional regulator [Nitrospira sp.]MBS0173639.1 sigma-54-dependent Fis family transcriptional regulator [Nitrospira sp.]MBS0177649.1 sigma-54-dependent Fis family transcriptional regulator [Nitrospira sp.]MBX3336867.1 sigma-54-dependent Fis family transcriptional regulator [Nitrospira sp.]
MTEEWGAVLVVDDDADMRSLLCDVLQGRGHQCLGVGSGDEALQQLSEEDYAVVLTDLRMKGMQGTELLMEVKQRYPDIGVILMTAFGTVETAVDAMRHGASDYLTKPVKTEELVRVVERAIREAALRREVSRLRKEVHKEYSFHQILGKSKSMQAVFELIRRVADSPTNVLITGESGTGKELVAKAIHYNSDRRDAPFVPVNCAAIPEQLLESELFGHMRGSFTDAKVDKRGLFEEAQKGTLFLDEISELPLMLQAKLLRAIQEREIRRVGATKSIPVDVRIIAATNLNLVDEVKHKRFREDFYYRLNVIELRLPPLRERREDIPILVDAFLKKCAAARGRQVKGLSEPALAMLADYAWPGNVRELENVIERAVTLSHGDVIGAEDLPLQVQGARGDRRILDEAAERTLPLHEVEKEYIVKILEKTGGNKYQAAHVLGIDRKTLYRKLAEIEGKPHADA